MSAAPPAPAPPRWTRNAELLVYVVPVGGTPPDVYAAYVRLLRAHRELPVASLTRPGAYAAELSPFRSFSWRGPGALRFRFVSTTEQLENVDGEDVHASNRPLGVLGVCHCPATPDLRAAYDQFAQSVRHFPGMLVQKCFAFEPRFDRATVDECGAIADLVMFPALHELDDGESTVSVHLRVVMDTLAVTILMSLEGAIRGAMRQQQQQLQQQQSIGASSMDSTGASSFLLDTNVEPTQSQVQHTNSMPLIAAQPSTTNIGPSLSSSSLVGASAPSGDARSRKRQIARQRKLFGDYSVMVACVPDAMEHYLAAIDLLKEEERRSGGAAGDALWLAAALEGYIFCLYLEARDRFVVEIVEKTSEAVSLYARAGTTELECSLVEKVGWYYVAVAAQLSVPPSPSAAAAAGSAPATGIDRVNESIWVKRLLWDALDRGLALFPELSVQRQIEFLVQGSRMLELLGHRRRMAFFLHDAVSVLLSRNTTHSAAVGTNPLSPESSPQRQKDLQAALLLERIAAARLGIQSGIESTIDNSSRWEVTTMYRRAKDKKRTPATDRKNAATPDDSWLVVRFHVLRQLLAISKMLGDPLLIGKYSLQLLEMLSWCDSIASPSSAAGKTGKSADPAIDSYGRLVQSSAIENLQRPAVASRAVTALPDGAGLYTKSSVYFTPPPSLETKTKRYFSLAASPSSTMSSAAASLSSTIANTPRILATPRQQLSAAVNAISTKASPAFVSFAHGGHSHGFNTNSSSNASTPLSTSSGNGGPFSMVSPAGSSDQLGVAGQLNSSSRDLLSDRSTSETEPSSAETAYGNGGSKPPSTKQQHVLFDLSAVRPVWNLRSREEVVKMEKKLLSVLETECGSLRPREQAMLSTFLRVDRFRAIHKVNAPLLSRTRAFEQYGGSAANASGGATTKSDFFYSPFEKQQQQRKKKVIDEANGADEEWDALHERAFPLREKIELQVVLSNPLGVAVEIQQMSVWVAHASEDSNPGGAGDTTSADSDRTLERSSASTNDVECYPCSLTLAPYEKSKSVVLGIRPLCTGSFRVLGCFIRAFNVRTSFVLAAHARLSLRVVDELPLAALSLVEVGTMAESGSEATKDRQGNVVRVTMYSSETKRCELRVRNIGQRAINNVRVAVAIRKRGLTRKTVVVLNNLTPGSVPVSTTVIETDRTVVQCDFGTKSDPLVPLASGEAIRIPFHVRLKQNVSDLDEATAGDEDEQLEWSVTYSNTTAGSDGVGDSDAVPSEFVRESKLMVETVALPSLAIASVWLVPSCSERVPGCQAGKARRTMDHSHCLAVIQIVNPTETVFKLQFRRRVALGGGVEPPQKPERCEIDVSRKSSKRVAIEIPRLDGLVATGKSLAAVINELVELEWQTYFGTKGHLVVRDNMWANSGGDDVLIELSRPPLSFEVAAANSSSTAALSTSSRGDDDADSNCTPTGFCFVDAPQLRAMARSSVRARLLELVPIVVTVCRGAASMDDAKSAEIAVRVSREGDAFDGDVLNEHVYAVGMVEKQIEWVDGSTQSQHEVQFMFLSEGVFVVTVYGQLKQDGESDRHCQVWSHCPLYVHVSSS